ncbi:MAG: FkbM family methyltransferase [Gammaproteobacteria bacterium]|nr:FkbM family methyltransferase [Gammaproteobacteria bacterium]
MKSFFKKAYFLTPFKKQLFSLLKIFWVPPANIHQHLHFHGDIKVTTANASSFKIRSYGYQVENRIFWNGLYGDFERHSLRLWTELCQMSDVIFDIGANTGIYALLAKAVNPSAKVYAFEPVERVYEKLIKNVELNRFDIACSPKAISNYNGEAVIYDTATEHTYSVTVNRDTNLNPDDSIEVKIQTITLDTFIEQEKLDKIDLLKIDVEMHEVEALQGFSKYLQRFQPSFLIEILNDDVANGVYEMIKDFGYEFYNIDEEKGPHRVERLSKSDVFNFLICKPEIANRLSKLLHR